ncbi:MAG: hypothetical protein EZS28_010253 [Streblomastix strix]|uniref:Uncharacterized protein n=1 Tax=Streblomastix strix TaxID=222440 RepID=A0A5J4WH37_9EUKA|nr:MAG: hypothetical protein EZS28_010253 [Streblomastix strix]
MFPSSQISLVSVEHVYVPVQNAMFVQEPVFDTTRPSNAFLAFLARDLCVGVYNSHDSDRVHQNQDGSIQIIFPDGTQVTELPMHMKIEQIFLILLSLRDALDLCNSELLQSMLYMRRMLSMERAIINAYSIPRFLVGNAGSESIKVEQMTVGNETLTLQFGSYSNFIGAHFWNFQEDYMISTYNDNNRQINTDILYRIGEADGISTYTPRLLLFDKKENLGSLRTTGYLYDLSPDPLSNDFSLKQDSFQSWEKVEVIKEQRKPRRRFLQNLLEEQDIDPDRDLEDDLLLEIKESDTSEGGSYNPLQQPLQNNPKSSLSNLTWSDIYIPHLHPRSPILFSSQSLTLDSAQIFQAFDRGRQLLSVGQSYGSGSSSLNRVDEDANERIEEGIRHYAEECDRLRSAVAIIDADEIWGAVAAGVLEMVADEVPKIDILAFPALRRKDSDDNAIQTEEGKSEEIENIQEKGKQDEEKDNKLSDNSQKSNIQTKQDQQFEQLIDAPNVQQQSYADFLEKFAAQYTFSRTLAALNDIASVIVPLSSFHWSQHYTRNWQMRIPHFNSSLPLHSSAILAQVVELYTLPFRINPQPIFNSYQQYLPVEMLLSELVPRPSMKISGAALAFPLSANNLNTISSDIQFQSSNAAISNVQSFLTKTYDKAPVSTLLSLKDTLLAAAREKGMIPSSSRSNPILQAQERLQRIFPLPSASNDFDPNRVQPSLHPLTKYTRSIWPPYPGRNLWAGDKYDNVSSNLQNLNVFSGHLFGKGSQLTIEEEREIRTKPSYAEHITLKSDMLQEQEMRGNEDERRSIQKGDSEKIDNRDSLMQQIINSSFNRRASSSSALPHINATRSHLETFLSTTPCMNKRGMTLFSQHQNIPITFPALASSQSLGSQEKEKRRRLKGCRTLIRAHCSPSLAIPLQVLGDTLQAHKYSGFVTGTMSKEDETDPILFLRDSAEAYIE